MSDIPMKVLLHHMSDNCMFRIHETKLIHGLTLLHSYSFTLKKSKNKTNLTTSKDETNVDLYCKLPYTFSTKVIHGSYNIHIHTHPHL